MQLQNPSPALYNEDLAPARERKWGAFSIFNVWTSDVHSLWGYYLAASLFLLCGSFVNFVLAIGIGSLVIFVLMTMVGNAGVRTGVPFPVLARASFGTFGANVPALVRAVVACFWYGAQTAAAAGALVALLVRSPALLEFHQTSFMLGHSTLTFICFLIVWGAQLLIIQNGMETVRRFQDWAGPAVWIVMLVLAVYLVAKSGTFSFGSEIPQDVLIAATRDAGVTAAPVSFAALAAVAATWITYFAALYLNFCDFSRYATDERALMKGNLWGLPVNLLAFCLVAGVTTTAAYAVYGEVLIHPEQISAKFDSLFLAILAALTFAVATLGINVVANFVSAAFDFSNTFPSRISFKGGGYIAALISLALFPWAPWETGAAQFVNFIGSTMGPIFGIIMVDYYLIRKSRLDVAALYQEDGEFRFGSGWHSKAFVAFGIGIVFSSILPTFTTLLPAWWGTYGWFFGVAVGGAVYHALRRQEARA
ncbi:NCS1 family nucleobase:cation symporter-1 [Paracoccus angustae]|uniref:NCS1 family nucleobase:cation symporter-1 n=2 Tax=Paracoccus angustae TaxID=1671480 RepID=A0ABV7U0D2_9RHOB